LKEVRGGFRLGKEFSFMKRLTEKDSKIQLYENARKVSNPRKIQMLILIMKQNVS